MGISFMFLLAVTLFCPVQTMVKTCRPNEFSCGDEHKSCLPTSWRCDGDKDCLNGADEEGCGPCRPTEFSCGDKRKSCLPTSWRCDGDKDCPNGADEEGCVTQHEDAPVTSKNHTVLNDDDLGSTWVTPAARTLTHAKSLQPALP
ncbi:uncharacterized protein LOC143721476 [Siphateles boraxobius]|uniref:uncharacterized protein LOC143721476 n=1 Tax=Siphateles boraxobius TaxID=180520 RepID=UPI00406438F3